MSNDTEAEKDICQRRIFASIWWIGHPNTGWKHFIWWTIHKNKLLLSSVGFSAWCGS
jgi:hypothetical protein